MDTLFNAVGTEVVLLVCFVMGYLFFNSSTVQKRLQGRRSSDGVALLEKQTAAHLASGQYATVLSTIAETPALLGMQVHALVDLNRAGEIRKILEDSKWITSLLSSAGMNAVLAQLPESAVAEVVAWFLEQGVEADGATTESLLNTHIASGDWPACVSLASKPTGLPARARAKATKEALRRDDCEAALVFLQTMIAAGLFVPGHLLAAYIQQACRSRSTKAVLEDVEKLSPSSEALGQAAEALMKDGEDSTADALLAHAAQLGLAASYATLDAVLKRYARRNDQRAFGALDRLVESGEPLQEGTCVAILALCAEGHNVPLAERVLAEARKAGCASVVVYSALMRVYAMSRLFHKTCDLYAALIEDGLKPDTIMYGSLIKAAVECGRLDLSKTLLQQSGTLDIQNYMSLFRACGRERNSRKAVELLGDLESSDVGVDTTAYNCVLDVCIKCGDKKSVANLFTKMKVTGYVDTISYNTLLKGMGAGATGLTDAAMVLAEMRQLGLQPNLITYNSLINFAISCGDVPQAWSFIKNMEEERIPVDNFTCSIMMKGLRHSSQPTDVDRTLSLIEQSPVTPDDVLVNTLLDACIRLRDVSRLTNALKTFHGSGVVPSEHSYGSVIKAYGHAKALPEAWATWREMLARKVRPSESTVTAMVDACTSNGAMADARLALREAAETGLTPATNTYMAMLRQCAQKKDMEGALQVYEEMPSPNLAAFNAVIDVCARCGDAEKAAAVFKSMMSAGVVPDLLTYTLVIKGYVVQGDLEQAIQLFTLMRKRNLQPDVALFNTLLDGLARKQMSTLVDHVLRDMDEASVTPNAGTLAVLVKLSGRNHDLDTAFAYVDTYKTKYGVEPNVQVHLALLTACANSGDMQRAAAVFTQLRSPDSKAYAAMITGYLKTDGVKDALQLTESALDDKVQLEQELLNNVVFMAKRRNLSTRNLDKKIAANGYSAERTATETGPTMTQRKQGKWREATAA
jgi:pentatricopeptide repeat protein